jgi:Arc/MetJ-type ribon-helix-helix transcriptional regulator
MQSTGKYSVERKTMQVSVRMPKDLYDWVDEWRAGIKPPPTRPEAIRQLLAIARQVGNRWKSNK